MRRRTKSPPLPRYACVLLPTLLFAGCFSTPRATQVAARSALVVTATGQPEDRTLPCRPPFPPPSARGSAAAGMAPGSGMGPPPPMQRTKRTIRDQFDRNRDRRLDPEERALAQAFILNERERSASTRPAWPVPPGLAGKPMPFGPFANRERPIPGPKLSLSDSVALPQTVGLYAPATLRTVWIQFENDRWEEELQTFYDSDVEVPAELVVDGKVYPDVGVRFRGMSSFMMVPAGFKRSLGLSIDAWRKDQRLLGYRSLNLLNAAHDPTFLRTVLALEVERHYVPAPKANHVRVVINGESWGVYVNAQQFNQDLVQDLFGTTEGRLWKVPGSPGGRGSLSYLGEEPKAYREIYQLKRGDEAGAYRDLVRLCRILAQSPAESLEQELAPLLDVDEVLRYLALDNLLVNNDGYLLRTSDYHLYQGNDGRFVIIAHDVNETFNALETGPSSAKHVGVELDPLWGADDPNKPLIARLLAVPKLRARYLAYLREMAETWLDWDRLGPIVEAYSAAIRDEVKVDRRKHSSFDEFLRAMTENSVHDGPCGTEPSYGLQPFVIARRAYLLNHATLRNARRD